MSTAAAAGGSGSGAADTGAVVVYVTVPDRDTGRKIAHSLLEHQLAACVNIIPGTPFFEGVSALKLIAKGRQVPVECTCWAGAAK